MGGTKVLGGGGAPIGSIVRSREIKKASEMWEDLVSVDENYGFIYALYIYAMASLLKSKVLKSSAQKQTKACLCKV